MKISILIGVVLLVSIYPETVRSYGGGAPPAVCSGMVPGHGADPQTTPNPYTIKLEKTAVQGLEQIEIVLTSPSENEVFKGFIVQVRKPGGNDAFGTFSDENSDGMARTMSCFEKKENAMTHTSGNDKKMVKMKWTAPNEEDAEYQVYYTVVGNDAQVYWTQIPHEEKIRVTRNLDAKTTSAPVNSVNPELLKKWKTIYEGCGETKGCFGIPGKCVEEYNPDSDDPITCEIMVTWKKAGEKNLFELTGRPGRPQGYVAVALSEDNSMGSDSVVGCSGTGNTIMRYQNVGQSNERYTPANHGLEENPKFSITDGNIFCEFAQKNHDLPAIKVDFEKNYYLLLARAPRVDGNNLAQHQDVTDRERSPQSIHISDNIILGASSNAWLIQLHGGLMVIAWLLCASTGMFTARYYKQTHTDFMPCGKAFWFLLHTFCMCATVFLTICGAIFIIVQKKGFDLKDWHPILGIIVVGLAILQVLIALCRPHPNTPKRPIFNWIHWGVGNTAHIIGIACIFLAWDLPLANLKKKFADEALWLWIMLALVLFHVLMHIVMSIHTLWADKEMDSNNKKRAMHPGPMKPNGLSSEAPGTGFRTFMLSLYLLVMAAGAIALFVLVFWPKPSEDDGAPTS